MDIKLTNGDIDITLSGDYCFVNALDEALQRAVLCAQIKKGSFIYNKDLGTELRAVDPNSPIAVQTANMILSEALMGMSEFDVKVSSFSESEDGEIKALIEADFGDSKKTAEVILNADL